MYKNKKCIKYFNDWFVHKLSQIMSLRRKRVDLTGSLYYRTRSIIK